MPVSSDCILQEQLSELHQSFVAGAGPGAISAAYSVGVVLPASEVIAQVTSAPLLADLLSGCARHVGVHYPVSTWHTDHVFVSNSPFLGGLSIDTVIVLVPVIGGNAAERLVGLAVQYRDFGAMAHTAFTLRRETRHEGFCLSLLRITAPDTRLPKTLLAMLRANVRYPDELTRWFAAQIAAARHAATDLAASGNSQPAFPVHAPPVSSGAADHLVRIPKGHFFGAARLQSPGDAGNDTQVRAELTISQASVHVTLSAINTDKVGADCNSPLSATRAAVLTALSDVAGVPPWILARWTSIDTGGSGIVNAHYPAAVAQGALTAFACYEAVLHALSKAGAAAGAARSFGAFAGRE